MDGPEAHWTLLASWGALLLAVGVSAWVLAKSQGRELEAPHLRPPDHNGSRSRRLGALLVLALALYVGVFQPASLIGREIEVDVALLRSWQLFWLHAVMVAALFGWFWLGFGRRFGERAEPGSSADRPSATRLVRRQLGLEASRPSIEVGIGLLCGAGAWAGVLAFLAVIGAVVGAVGGEAMLPAEPPPVIVWIAGQSVILRLAVSVSAGCVEEIFFRGFLQPRIGVAASTALFALAHAGYAQPLLLVGVTLLSLVFALLTRWRRNVVAAVVAHTVFDAVQLLFLIPLVLRQS